MSTTDNNPGLEAAKAEYMAADAKVTEITKMLEVANRERSNKVKQLNDKYGKGPYSYNGQFLGKIVIRDSDHGTTYFFRSMKGEKVL